MDFLRIQILRRSTGSISLLFVASACSNEAEGDSILRGLSYFFVYGAGIVVMLSLIAVILYFILRAKEKSHE